MERNLSKLIVLALLFMFCTPEIGMAQKVKSKSYQRAYSRAMECTKREKLTPIPEFTYHIETVLSMNSAFMLNDLTLDGFEHHELYKHNVPDLTIRALFIKSGRYSRIGLEGGIAYISVPTIKAKGMLTKFGIASGSMKYISEKFLLNRGLSIGYMLSSHNVSEPAISGRSHGVYFSSNTSLLYETSKTTAIGLNFSISMYHLWDWHYTMGKPSGDNKSRPGFGIYPTFGISYYIGGL